mmetsp:Transcript_35997/g.80114  ORF Transcript_35997/g.80114 Transcript_35997/m.80114 type:complete len:330 (-) Transcript_35997:444-1433(-)
MNMHSGQLLHEAPRIARRNCLHTLTWWQQVARKSTCRSIARAATIDSNATSSITSQQQSSTQQRVAFPFDEKFNFDGQLVDSERVVELLAPFMFEDRIQRIDEVVAQRTFSVLPVVEGLYDMGNLAAVCRTADAFGFGSVHCINSTAEKYKQSARTSAGADKWLNVTVWGPDGSNGPPPPNPNGISPTRECLSAVKAAGYQVVVTHLSKSSITIQEVDFSRPTAFVLGNERDGVSEEAVALADLCAIIPMAGFVESFNISVAAALVMYEAQQQRIRKFGRSGDLTPEQQRIVKAALMMRSVREGPTVIRELLNRPPQPWQGKQAQKRFF